MTRPAQAHQRARQARYTTKVRPKTPGLYRVSIIAERRHPPPHAARPALKYFALTDRPQGMCCRGFHAVARCRTRSGPPAIAGCCFVLAAHLMVLPAFAVTQGWSLGGGVGVRHRPRAASAPPRAPGAFSRTVRSSLCAMALLTCSAVLVVAWHGTTEAHFHYFVMVGALALYEEWWAYLLADRLRRPPARRDRRDARRDRLPPQPQPVALGGASTAASWPRSRSRTWSRGARASACRAASDAPRSASGARSTTRRSRWRWSRPRGRVLQGNRELRERTGHDARRRPVVLGLRARRRPRRAARELAAGADAPEVERRYVRADGSDRLVPLAPLARSATPTASPTTTSPRASTSPPASATPSGSTTRPTTTR